MTHEMMEYQALTRMKIPSDSRSPGFIYVLKNDLIPGAYKMSMTKNEPEVRAKEISSTTGVSVSFKVIAAFHSSNPRADERMVHEAFSDCRVNQNREFFSPPSEREIADVLHKLGYIVGPERNDDVAGLAVNDFFISFSNEQEIDLSEELYEQGIGGIRGNILAVKNLLIRSGVHHVKNLIDRYHASIVINPGSSISLVKSYEKQWEEAQREKQCSES